MKIFMRFSLKHMFVVQVVILMIISNAVRYAFALDMASESATDQLNNGSVLLSRQPTATDRATNFISSLDMLKRALVQLETMLNNELQHMNISRSNVERPKIVCEIPTSKMNGQYDDSKTNDSINDNVNGKRLRFMSAFGPFANFLRVFAKQTLDLYNWYYAEIQFGECMIKYAYTQYPEQVQLLRMENINKLGHSAYTTIVDYLTNVLSGRYMDTFAEEERIAAKVAQLTRPHIPMPQQKLNDNIQSISNGKRRRRRKREKPLRKQRSTVTITNKNETKFISATTTTTTEMPPDVNDRMEHRLNDEDNSWLYFENHRKQWHEDVYKRYIQDQMDDDDEEEEEPKIVDEKIELNKIRTVEAVDDLFDWEPILLEGLGIDLRRVKKYSPGFCIKNYVFAFMRRIIMEYIRSA